MAIDIHRLPIGQLGRLAPVDPRLAPAFCFALLTVACALASFAFTCATPFAAFAVLAAAMLPLSMALLVVAAAWIVNQAIGFGALGYPIDLHMMLWGLAIGVAALAATAIAAMVLRFLPRIGWPAALGVALVAAYAGYELVLFACTPALGGAGAFTLTIVARLGLLNILWAIGLWTVCAGPRLINLGRERLVS